MLLYESQKEGRKTFQHFRLEFQSLRVYLFTLFKIAQTLFDFQIKNSTVSFGQFQTHGFIKIMKSNKSLKCPLVLVKICIPILQKIQGPLKDLFYIQGQKSLLLYKDCAIIIDLNNQKNQQKIIINLPPVSQVIPFKESVFCQHQFSSILMNLNKNQESRILPQFFEGSHQFFVFKQSGKVFGYRMGSFYQINQRQNITSLPIHISRSMISKADDVDSIYYSTKNTDLWIFNLSQNRKFQLQLPFPIKKLERSYDFRIANKQLGLYLLKDQREGVIFGFFNINDKKLQYSPLLQFPEYDYGGFTTMNQQLCLVMFSLTKALRQRSRGFVKTVIYNYETNSILLNITTKNWRMFSHKKVDPEFKYFIDSVNTSGELVVYKSVHLKKLLLHIIKKSQLETRFGKILIQKVLKVMF